MGYKFSNKIAFYLLMLFYLLIVWYFPYIPGVDLPNHLASVHIINQIIHGNSFLSKHISYNLFKSSILGHVIILILAQFFSVIVAAKILFSLYILLFFFSVYYFSTTFKLSDWKMFSLLLLTFNIYVYFGTLGFFLSFPAYMLLFSYWYKNKLNYLFIAFSLILLFFLHIFTTMLFLFSIIYFKKELLVDYKFYLALLPFILLLIPWLSQSVGLTGINVWQKANHLFLKRNIVYGIIKYFAYNILFVLITNLIFLLLIISLIIYYLSFNYQFKINNFSIFFIILLTLVVFLPNLLPGWQLFSSRFVPFAFLFSLFLFPCVKNGDEKGIMVIILILNLIALIYVLIVFYSYEGIINKFTPMLKYIKLNSSIAYIHTPSRNNISLAFANFLFYPHHYLVIFTNSTYPEDLYNNWYNPIKYKDAPFNSFTYDKKAEKTGKCEDYKDYFKKLTSNKAYPFYDYIIILANECNALNYFLKDYKLIYKNKGGPFLLKLKSDS